MTEPAAADELNRDTREDGWRVALPVFEGPLDLLLHLIQKHELDILDIPISFVTEKYLEYLNLMRDMAIDVASEYLVMAATLAHIKSKMLLPSVPSDQDDALDEEELDPRGELVRRLLEYQKYKNAAADLASRSVLGKDVFARGPLPTEAEGPAPLESVGVFALIDAFNRVAARRKITLEHEVSFDRVSISERINEIVDMLKLRSRSTLEEILPETFSRSELVITFLALLEMTRLKLTRLYQASALSELYIELALIDGESPEPDPSRSSEP
ncbi:MAG: segregation/condensation protein A [Deltaproteobacteria bacterium]|nr:segregation/condensation protein A [Deltaproteobacteria bacterium]